MDDVGWGDFGCYGGGVAVGAPTPNIDRLAREGLLLTSLLLGAVVHAVARVAHDRPAPDAPRPACARRCTASPAACRARSRSPQLLSRRRLRDAGGRQVAHGRERRVASRRTSASTTSTASSPSPTCTPSGATRTSSPRSSTPRSAPSGSRTSRSTSASCTPKQGRRARERRGGHDPGPLAARRQVVRLLAATSSSAWPGERHSRGSSTTARAARTSTTTRTPTSSASRRRSTRTRTRSSSSTTSSAGWSTTLERDRAARRHDRLHHLRQRPGDGDLARRGVHAVPLREGLDVGRRPAGARPIVAGRG